MNQSPNPSGSYPSTAADLYDEGLRSYMLKIYNHMVAGLAVTGLVAFWLASSPETMAAIIGSWLVFPAIFAPFLGVFLISFGVRSMSASAVTTIFYIWCASFGISMSFVAVQYSGADIARAFFITSGAFAALCAYGYTTRTPLSGMAAFLVVGLFGIVLSSIVNLFLGSSALEFAISAASVVVFGGLAAWDTQKLKENYNAADDAESSSKLAILGAVDLYLDFLNLFLAILRLMGNKK